jgi:hypothetical protein
MQVIGSGILQPVESKPGKIVNIDNQCIEEFDLNNHFLIYIFQILKYTQFSSCSHSLTEFFTLFR